MINSKDADTILNEIELVLPPDNALIAKKLKQLRSYISEMEYLVNDLAEGLEDDSLNERVNALLDTEPTEED